MKTSILNADQLNKIRENFSGEIRIDEPMKLHTSFHIGGCADLLVVPKDVDDLKYIMRFTNTEELSITFIGNGTNLLVSDDGIRGIVVKISNTLDYIFFDGLRVRVGAGANLPTFVRKCAERGLSGLQFAYGIPGSVGGAIAMNAGAYGGTIGELIEEVRALDLSGEEVILTKEDMKFAHRESRLQSGDLIAFEATLLLEEGEPEAIAASMSEYSKSRREKQPLNLPSAGCAFKNPSGGGAGRYIDMAGLKGTRIGDAEVSLVHANFIVNVGNAKASDVLELIKLVQVEILRKYGVELVPEIKIIGETQKKS